MLFQLSARPAVAALAILAAGVAVAESGGHGAVDDGAIAAQRATLAAAAGEGFGPQAPRDITVPTGNNPIVFSMAPHPAQMNLCNIHFHEAAEHRGGEFTTSAGNGDGHGRGSGFRYDGTLTEGELAPVDYPVGSGAHDTLEPGDTIEIHYVHTTARVLPGPTLAACLDEATGNPQLRVEAYVYVLVNDESAADIGQLNAVSEVDGRWRAAGMPLGLGTPVTYAGSTTGPGYNETGSPFQVTWNVHPEVLKVSISSVAAWLADNPFDEDHAHGVRNLVINPDLLSPLD